MSNPDNEYLLVYNPETKDKGGVRPWNIHKAFENGFVIEGTNPEQKIRITDSVTGKSDVTEAFNLPKVFRNKEDSKRYFIGKPDNAEIAQAFVQGATSELGRLADIAIAAGNYLYGKSAESLSNVANTIGMKDTSQDLKDLSEKAYTDAKKFWDEPQLEKLAHDSLDTGMNHHKSIKIAKSSGEFAGSLPEFALGGGAFKLLTTTGRVASKVPFVNKLNKFLTTPFNAKTAISFAAMGAGAEYLKKDSASVEENIVREIVGSVVASAIIPSYSKQAVKGIWDFTKGAIKNTGNLTKILNAGDGALRAYLLKSFTNIKPNKESFAALEKIGIEPTVDIISHDSKFIGYLAQQKVKLSDSIIKNASEKALVDIEYNLDKQLGDYLGKHASDLKSAGQVASDEFIKQTDKHLQTLVLEKDALYKNAMNKGKGVKALPKNTVEMIDKLLPSLSAPTTSNTKETGQGLVVDALTSIKKVWGKSKQVPLEQMDAQLRALGEMKRTAGYKTHAPLLGAIEKAIFEDIKTAGSQEFMDSYTIAKQFYKDQIVPYVKTDIGKALLSGKPPKSAYDMTSTASNIQILKDMVKNQPKGEQVVNLLLRTRSQEKIVENCFKDGKFSPKKFISFFTESKNDEYLFALLGKSHQSIKDNIVPVARAIEYASTHMANPSGSGEFIRYSGAVAGAVTSAAAAVVTGNVAAGAAGAAAAVGTLLLPKMLAEAFLDPKVARKLVNASKKGDSRSFKRVMTDAFFNSTKAIKETVLKEATRLKNHSSTKASNLIRSTKDANNTQEESIKNKELWEKYKSNRV